MTCSCLACKTERLVLDWAEGRSEKRPDDETIKEVLLRVVRTNRLRRDVDAARHQKERVHYAGRDDLH
jgi:hypothetical protein